MLKKENKYDFFKIKKKPLISHFFTYTSLISIILIMGVSFNNLYLSNKNLELKDSTIIGINFAEFENSLQPKIVTINDKTYFYYPDIYKGKKNIK